MYIAVDCISSHESENALFWFLYSAITVSQRCCVLHIDTTIDCIDYFPFCVLLWPFFLFPLRYIIYLACSLLSCLLVSLDGTTNNARKCFCKKCSVLRDFLLINQVHFEQAKFFPFFQSSLWDPFHLVLVGVLLNIYTFTLFHEPIGYPFFLHLFFTFNTHSPLASGWITIIKIFETEF